MEWMPSEMDAIGASYDIQICNTINLLQTDAQPVRSTYDFTIGTGVIRETI
jgi:hypothetical protein